MKIVAFLCLLLSWSLCVWAGGSGLNVVVIANQNSSNSCDVANYYCERRGVPPENQLRISWPGSITTWSGDDFQTNLLGPLTNMLRGRGLTNQIEYVVLSMDIPFQTVYRSTYDSTTAVLFYGLKPDPVGGTKSLNSSYAGVEAAFSQNKPVTGPGYSFLTTMITGNTVAQAKRLVDQGVNSDGTFPRQPIMLTKSSDPLRNIRWIAFNNAIFNARVAGNSSLLRTNSDSCWGQTNLMGYETGLANFSVSPNTFAPGAMADSLTSYGGIIFGDSGQTSLMAFISAGAAGSYGTVSEPLVDPSKFPDPQVYFYQARGFSLAECYYQSIMVPYLGLIVGEPLAAPFGQPASVQWVAISSNVLLHGTVPLAINVPRSTSRLPLNQLDLFVDGKYFQTVTNFPPQAGNVLTVTLNGYPVNYTVPSNASLTSVATGLVGVLNAPAVTNITKVAAFAHGDRVELHSVSSNRYAEPIFFSVPMGAVGSGSYFRAVNLPQNIAPQLAAAGRDPGGAFHLRVEAPAARPLSLEASTNLQNWFPISMTANGGPQDLVDADAGRFPSRFYRVGAALDDPRISLAVAKEAGGGVAIYAHESGDSPYVLQASTNLIAWTPVATNFLGGAFEFYDTSTHSLLRRFYRAVLAPQQSAPPALHFVSASSNSALFRIDTALQPFVIQTSSDLYQWSNLITNFSPGTIRTEVAAARGTAAALSTFLTPGSATFLDSTANGYRTFSAGGPTEPGAWLTVEIWRTNHPMLSLSVTNESGNISDLTTQLVYAINNSGPLQAGDGIFAGDTGLDPFGGYQFNLTARIPGWDAAGIQVRVSGSSLLTVSPANQCDLRGNLSDLQPRNHLFVNCGATNFAVSFPFDTTALPDGFHELTAVAYEGSSVRTQSRATIYVRVQNSNLSATLTLLDLPESAPVQGTYQIQVTASTDQVSGIRLFSSGGLLAATNSQSNATFTVNGSLLGKGIHPFYTIVEASDGRQYRSATRWIRFY